MGKRSTIVSIAAVAALGSAMVASAQSAGSAKSLPPPPPPPIELHALTPNIYWARELSNVGVIVGDRGVVVFDTGSSVARAKELLAAIARITVKPIDTVVISHADSDHVGGLAAFPAGIRVIAQSNAIKTIREDAAAGRGPGIGDRAGIHAVEDHEDLVLDGVKVQLLHWAPAHTSGDLVMYLPDQQVIFSGDIFCMDPARAYVKPEAGGSTAGWIKMANSLLKLDADRIVVGHGGVENKTTLHRFADASAAEYNQVKALIAKGRTLQQIEAEVNEPPPSPTGPSHWIPYAQVVYEELTHLFWAPWASATTCCRKIIS
jgi:glyoxylase-like metal-dependent hydrolase (beta-lactamase superfamily II)